MKSTAATRARLALNVALKADLVLFVLDEISAGANNWPSADFWIRDKRSSSF